MPQGIPVRVLLNAVQWFEQAVLAKVAGPLNIVLQHYGLPESVQILNSRVVKLRKETLELYRQAEQAAHAFDDLRRLLSLDEQGESILKMVLLRFRRFEASSAEQFLDKVHDPATRDRIVADLQVLDGLLPGMLSSGSPPSRMPSLLDFISLRDAALYLQETQQSQRVYDEKFHILQAPSLFLTDLQYHRSVCDLRQIPCSVAFIDIDKFKEFNCEVTESEVDRSVLPQFMRILEAHFYGHGQAYRQGGDEYLAILPGLSRQFAMEFFDELRGKLAKLSYPCTRRQTTVSIGLCIAQPDCLLSDRELQQKANQAKEHAKRSGRNCISTFKGDVSYSVEMEKVRPLD